MGMIVIAAAIFNDLVGWIIFGLIVGMMGMGAPGGFTLGWTIGLTLLLAGFCLTVLRWGVHRLLPWLQAHTTWPGGVLSFALSLALFGAAFAEWIGIHAVFGAFLVGVAIGDSPHLRERTRTIILQFISFVFAPLFFASIGLGVNFVHNFDLPLVLTVLTIACVGKLVGCYYGARLVNIDRREALAVGFAMNARGAMEIILGLLALQYGVIEEPMFVALVVMALLTSMASGPLIQWILRLRTPRHFSDYLSPKAFVQPLIASDTGQAIEELASGLAGAADLPPQTVVEHVLTRERLMSTGLGNGIAVPHARIPGLKRPAMAVGLSLAGVDFNAPDGEPSHIILMVLIPQPHDGTEVEILADIARTFDRPEAREAAMNVKGYTEFLAMVRSRHDREA
jgi:mannitol/fructose-specific phosphotransferase system IIA component (Ntr-type)